MSNQIKESLKLDKSTIVELAFYPGAKGLNAVLTCKAPLTIEASKTLKCESRFFSINETPITDFTGNITLKSLIKSCFVKVAERADATNALIPDLVRCFKIGLGKNGKPFVEYRMHFDSQWRHLLVDICDALGTDEFPLEIAGTQPSLFEEAEAGEDGEGSRVDLSEKQMSLGEEEVVACQSCADRIPADESGMHENGSQCDFRRAAAAAVQDIPVEAGNTLPSARAMAGGTTAAARKQRRSRNGSQVVDSDPLPADPGAEEWTGEREFVEV